MSSFFGLFLETRRIYNRLCKENLQVPDFIGASFPLWGAKSSVYSEFALLARTRTAREFEKESKQADARTRAWTRKLRLALRKADGLRSGETEKEKEIDGRI